MYSKEDHQHIPQMHAETSNLASPRISHTTSEAGLGQPHSFVIPGIPAPPAKPPIDDQSKSSNQLRASTTDFVADRDPEKQITKVTIMSNAKKPLTEFVNRKDRLENNMFLSGYINRPAGGAGRFESSGVRESVSSSTLKPLSPANQAGSGGLTQSINMAESTFMSTSMYMGQVVTNRFANAGNAAVIPANDRSKNVMYHSQALKAGAGPQTNSKPIKQDIKLFTIPSKVQQYVDNSQNEYKYLEKDVLAEKTKMNAELDSIQKEILLMIQQKRAELNTVFDGYLESFKANIETTKNKMISFKDTSEWVKMQNSENGDRPVRLTDIAYYSKDAKEGVYKSYKKEAHKNICELRNLKQEVQKHNLEFFVAELERMGIHYPTFANTASSAEFLSEIKDRLFGSVRSGMEDFHKLAYSAPFVSFNEVYSEPHILTSLGESRLNCLINIRDISVTPYTSSKHHELSHEQEVTTLLNIDDESIATGDKAGSIHVYNLTQNKETHKFKMKGVTQITSLGRIRTTYELVAGGEQMVTSQMFDEKEKHDRNIFLISGHAKPDCFISIWDLKKQAFVKQLKGHTDDITSITSLQDGHTLLTGSKSGATLIYNIIKKKPIKSIQNLVNSPVNCIYTFNDLARFAIGHNNGEITICSIMYEIGVQDKMAVCSSAAVKCTLKSKSPVLCINESHTNPNTAITGHADGKLRIWDLSSAKIIKEFEANKSPIMATLVIENPFGLNLEENYHIVSCGDTSEDISIHQPKQEKHCPLDVHAKFNFKSSMGHNPRLQMIRREADAVHFAAFSNEDNKKEIVLVTVK